MCVGLTVGERHVDRQTERQRERDGGQEERECVCVCVGGGGTVGERDVLIDKEKERALCHRL